MSDQINLGFDAYYQAVRTNDPAIETFAFEKSMNAHHAFTGITPKIKIAPFDMWSNISIETGVFIPLANDPEGRNHERPYLASGDFEWQTEIFYVNNLSKDFQLFTELDAYWRISDEGPFSNASWINSPAKVFLSWFPAKRWSVYGMAEFNPTWGGNMFSSAYYQNGIGFKYQLTNALEIEGLYTNFLVGKNGGAGQTFNIGFRFQR